MLTTTAFSRTSIGVECRGGIVTNGSTTGQHVACKAAGLDQLAPFIIVSEAAGYKKPDPRIFRDALELTGLASPEQVMFVGDNPLSRC